VNKVKLICFIAAVLLVISVGVLVQLKLYWVATFTAVPAFLFLLMSSEIAEWLIDK
jgi:hypothetical protein